MSKIRLVWLYFWYYKYVIVFYENGSFCWRVVGWVPKDE